MGLLMSYMLPSYHPTNLFKRQSKEGALKFGNPGKKKKGKIKKKSNRKK